MYEKTINSRTIFGIFFLLFGMYANSAFAQNRYDFSLKVEKQTIYVDLFIELDSATHTFIFNDSALISKIETTDSQNIQYSRNNSTLVFDSDVQEFEISYSLDKKMFSLDDGTLMLKKEGAWYPIISNMLFSSELTIEYDNQKYYAASGGYISDNHYYLDSANEVSVIFLPTDNYTVENDTISDIEFRFYYYPDKHLPEDVKQLFTDAVSFFFDYFSDGPFDILKIIYLGGDDLRYAQTLNDIVIFDAFFLDMHLENPENSWIPHEVAHQWWGKSLFFDSEAQYYRFMEESLTEYLKTEFVKHSYSDSVHASVFQTYKDSYDYVIGDNPNRLTIRDVTKLDNQENSIIIYCKGPLLLQKIIVKYELDFKSFIRKFYHKYKGQQVSYLEFYNSLKNDRKPVIKVLDAELKSYKKAR